MENIVVRFFFLENNLKYNKKNYLKCTECGVFLEMYS